MAHEWREYIVTVHDPIGPGVRYEHVKAVSEEHAERQAKDGYTGLFGDVKARQRYLTVTIEARPEGAS